MKLSDHKVTRVNFPKLGANPQLIVLTVEEAKIVLHGLTFGAYVTTNFVKEQQYLSVAETIEKRIEHAVMSKQST